jgi:UDPglucose 6-dehydrogenase
MTDSPFKHIGILGVGVVGGAVKAYFEKEGITPLVYDTGKKLGSLEEVNQADVVFVCVPTPFVEGHGFDLSYVKTAIGSLTGNKVVVVKSTVVPGTTQAFQKEFPQHTFLFNPEFLTEHNAVADMQNPDRQIVGFTEKGKPFAEPVLKILPKAPFQSTMGATEAEMVKYFGNTFLSVKVVFANQMYDLCQKLGIDYDRVAEAASQDSRIGKSHLQIFHEGYRGYSGMCFPKDMNALIQFADAKGVDLELHKTARSVNDRLLGEKK